MVAKKPKHIRRGNGIHETGRVLDMRVAKEVFGWETRVATATPVGTSVMTANPPALIFYKKPGEKEEHVLPLFSTSDQAAFELFKLLRESGRFCCLRIDSDYHYVWSVRLNACRLFFEKDDDDVAHRPDVIVEGSGFPYVMCLAAIEGARVYKALRAKTDELREKLKPSVDRVKEATDAYNALKEAAEDARANSCGPSEEELLRIALAGTPTTERPKA